MRKQDYLEQGDDAMPDIKINAWLLGGICGAVLAIAIGLFFFAGFSNKTEEIIAHRAEQSRLAKQRDGIKWASREDILASINLTHERVQERSK